MIMRRDSTLPVILLAAGRSSRMRGRDKLLELVSGQPLLGVQIRRAQAATRGQIIVTVPPAPHARRAIVEATDVTCVTVDRPQDGMSVSLRTALAALSRDTAAAMVALPDLVALESDDLAQVLAAVDLASDTLIWRGATEDGRPGHPVVFHADLFSQLSAVQGDQGGASVARAHLDRTVFVPLAGARALRDLDTPEDWATWRAEEGARGLKNGGP